MQAALQQAGRLINRILALDPESLAELSRHRGRRLDVVITGTAARFSVLVTDAGIDLSTAGADAADVTVRGTPSQFLGFLGRLPERRGTAAAHIEIAGDVDLARDIQAIMGRLEPDWEEELSRWLGDSLARKLGNLGRRSAGFARESVRTLGLDVSEYLRFETEALPDRTEVDEFNAAVDTLRDDAERLRARVKRLRGEGRS